MKIFAKSLLSKDELDVKMQIGCDGIEIQLFDELIDKEAHKCKSVQETFDLSQFNDYPVLAVHAPLLNSLGCYDILLEYLASNDSYLLKQVFYLANYFGELHNTFVNVVVHTETSYENIKRIANSWDIILRYISDLLSTYPKTRLSIENVCVVRSIEEDFILTNNYKWSNAYMAREMCRELQTDRVGTVLDTCHAKIAKRYSDSLCKVTGVTEDLSLDRFFAENSETVHEIHLADAKRNGSGFGNHGLVPTPSFISQFNYLYKKYGYTCPVVVEVSESNYLVCENYRKTLQLLRDNTGY